MPSCCAGHAPLCLTAAPPPPQASLGVGPSNRAQMFVVLSPVGPYYPEGFKPVKLMADEKHIRAWPGGTGDCKVAGYAWLAPRPPELR